MTPLQDKFFMTPSCTCHLLPGPYPGQSRPLCGTCADALRQRTNLLADTLEKCLQRAHAAEQRVRELEAAALAIAESRDELERRVGTRRAAP